MASNHHNEENDFNKQSEVAWYRPWLLVAFLAFILIMLVRGCKNTFNDRVYPTSETTSNLSKNQNSEQKNDILSTTDNTKVSAYSFIRYSYDSIYTGNANETMDLKVIAYSFLKMKDGSEMAISHKGLEEQLAIFINDENKKIDKTTWFNFDKLLFETGKAILKPESKLQLMNTSAILKSYPAVRLKVGAYTDNTGDSLKNVTLSDARAKETVKQLVALGIAADRLEAEGYGPMHPIADNNTEEGKAMNRRVAIRVLNK